MMDGLGLEVLLSMLEATSASWGNQKLVRIYCTLNRLICGLTVGTAVYSASKAAIISLTRSDAIDVSPTDGLTLPSYLTHTVCQRSDSC